MNAKTREAFDIKCNLYYIIGTMFVFVIMLIIPGILSPNRVILGNGFLSIFDIYGTKVLSNRICEHKVL